MNWKSILRKMGYYNRCPACGKETASRSRLIGELIYISCFFFVLYFYLTGELPYMKAVANCTLFCYDIYGPDAIPIINNTGNSTSRRIPILTTPTP